MKKLVLSLAILSLTSLVFAQESGIKFEKPVSWKALKAKATEERKYIFLDVYATWCVPCKAMETDVYPNEELGKYMNEKFISVKVQADKLKNDNEFVKGWYADANEIMSTYQVNAFPCLLFLSPDGSLMKKAIGYADAHDLVHAAEESIDSAQSIDLKLHKYQEGKLGYQEIAGLAMTLRTTGNLKRAQDLADDYINNYLFTRKEAELFTTDNLIFMGKFISSDTSRVFKFFNERTAKINEVLGEYQAQKKIMDFIDKKFLPQDNTWKRITPEWDKVEKLVTAKFEDLGKEIVLGEQMIYYMDIKDWVNFGVYYKRYFEIALKHSSFHINNMSWAVFEHVNDPLVLKFATQVMKYDIENISQNDPVAWDTYANLLHKTGKTKEAIYWEQKAVEMKKGQPDEKLYTDAIEKMKNGVATWIIEN